MYVCACVRDTESLREWKRIRETQWKTKAKKVRKTFGFRECGCVYRWKRDGERESVFMCFDE